MPTNLDQTINYLELPAGNFEAVQMFYEKAFGWTFTDYGPEYRAFNDGTINGGFYKSELRSGVAHGKRGKTLSGGQAKAMAIIRIVAGSGCILFGLFKLVAG